MKHKLIALLVGIAISSPVFAAGGKMLTVHVNGMVCQFCSQGITKKFKANDAVETVHVDMEKKEVHLSLKEGKELTDAQITDTIKDAGVNVDRIAARLGSVTTIFCCFLPALFVALGAGAAFASLLGAFPQLVWLSEHKLFVFGFGGLLILIAGVFQWRSRYTACPIDPKLAEGCGAARNWSRRAFLVAVSLYSLGFFFAFVLPRVFT
jgi:copper chaperone CopZ